MGSYHYVQLACLQFFLYLVYFLGCLQAAHIVDGARHILKPGCKCVVMLKGKDGGRHKHGHLLAVRYSLECGPDGNLRLAESHIAADQTVHRTVVLHVPLDCLAGLFLVRRVFVHER